MDNSIGTANAAIVDALRGAGDIGLSLIDLVDVIGAKGQQHMVLKRLQDLVNRNQVISLPNNSWMIREDPPAGFIKQNSQPVTSRPSINLPGTTKFSSFKNSLQEYCQKRKAAVPSYKQERTEAGFLGTVSFLSFNYTAEAATDNPKDADQRAAFAALKSLGYIPNECKYNPATTATGSKRTSEMENLTPSKQQCTGNGLTALKTSKSELNELAQKNKLSQPTYENVSTPSGFFCTVTFNGRQFKSSRCCNKKKDAEQNAADVALIFLRNPQIAQGITNTETQTAADVDNMIKSARVASNVMKFSLKNRLQEYCQRLKKELPVYENNRDESGLFTSKVIVDGKTFTGQPFSLKKEAEKSAAEAALKELGLMAVVQDA